MNQPFEELSVTVMSFKLFYYNSIRACNWNKNVDIKFSVHNKFLK
jgi:hypothetical protein